MEKNAKKVVMLSMSKRWVCSLTTSALFGLLCIVPLWLNDYSAMEIVFGRFLMFAVPILMILPFRLDVLHRPTGIAKAAIWRHALMLTLTGHIGYYLFLVLSVKTLGGLAGCWLIGILPMLLSLLHQNRSCVHSTRRWLSVFLSFAGLVLLMFETSALVESSSDKEYLATGVLWLLLAGICWLWSACLQSAFIKRYPEIDRSHHLMLSGLSTCLILVALFPLMWVSESECCLFAGSGGGDRSIFWVAAMVAGVCSTLLARILWNNSVAFASERIRLGGLLAEPLLAAILVFLFETRWPDAAEWSIVALCGASMWVFYHDKQTTQT